MNQCVEAWGSLQNDRPKATGRQEDGKMDVFK
jgi:hypothetical protein